MRFDFDAHCRNQIRLSKALVNRKLFGSLKIERFEPELIESEDDVKLGDKE